MSYSVKVLPKFARQLKKLARKYPSLKEEYAELVRTLKADPIQGVSIGRDCYKVRLSISSKGKGKSGGARVIANVLVMKNMVYLLVIYDKSERDSISDKELKELLKAVPRSDSSD